MKDVTGSGRSFVTTAGSGRGSERTIDQPLNFRDQVSTIRKTLSRLDVERAVYIAKEALPVLLLGTGLRLLYKRRRTLGAAFLLGALVQKRLESRFRSAVSNKEDLNEIELKRYALKAERGDFGTLEVIPFR